MLLYRKEAKGEMMMSLSLFGWLGVGVRCLPFKLQYCYFFLVWCGVDDKDDTTDGQPHVV